MKFHYIFIFIMFFPLVASTILIKDRRFKKKDIYTPIVARVLENTAPFLGSDNKYHLVYGLELKNASKFKAHLKGIHVINENITPLKISHYSEKDISARLYGLNGYRMSGAKIEANGSRIFFIALTFKDNSKLPKNISHTIYGHLNKKHENSSFSYKLGRLRVLSEKPVVIDPPLKGHSWVIINGCCSFKGAHQTATHAINGQIHNPQRFALDLMKLSDEGRFVEGNTDNLSNWHSYGQDVLAVASGEVVKVINNQKDQPPGKMPDPRSITMNNYAGNYIVLKLNTGIYAFYAHILKGSIKVKEGDYVKALEPIAKIGNSGNTSAPHLHLHLMSTPSPLGSKPLSYVFSNFRKIGKISKNFYNNKCLTGFFENIIKDGRVKSNQFPLDLSVVNF